MTVEQIKKNAKVMLAFTQGNEIQARPLGIQDENAWKDESSPNFDFNLYEYRVKENTESEYRPFENIKECWEEMLKHQPFGWIIDVEPENCTIPSEYADAGCIVNVGEDFICLAPYLQATNEGNVQNNSVIPGNYTYSEALKYFWFMDGTPFGIKKTESSMPQLP